jgi:hypothetical protein
LSTQSCGTARREAEGQMLVNRNTPLPPGFSQVFILKTVKVLCFDTLLQVFILNDFQADLVSSNLAMNLAARHRQNARAPK